MPDESGPVSTNVRPFQRSLLVVPASRPDMVAKALKAPCDAVVIDLEDAVAPSAKLEARSQLKNALRGIDRSDERINVRINGAKTGWFLDDILALEGLPISTVVLPKAEDAGDVYALDRILGQLEWRNALHDVSVHLLIESALGLQNIVDLVKATRRVDALIFGAADYLADTGIAFAPESLAYPRAVIATAAAAAKIEALDLVYPEIHDDEGLRRDAENARNGGFTGKWAIHPRQLPIINDVFTPAIAERDEAERIILAYDNALANGAGAILVDGKLVDEASVRALRRKLAAARLNPSPAS